MSKIQLWDYILLYYIYICLIFLYIWEYKYLLYICTYNIWEVLYDKFQFRRKRARSIFARDKREKFICNKRYPRLTGCLSRSAAVSSESCSWHPRAQLDWESLYVRTIYTVYFSYFLPSAPFERSNKIIAFRAAREVALWASAARSKRRNSPCVSRSSFFKRG